VIGRCEDFLAEIAR